MNPPEARSETRTSQSQTSIPRTSTSLPVPPMPTLPFGPQGPAGLTSVRHLIPVPLSSMGSLQTFDSALPCHSVWALDTSRRRHNAGGSRTAVSLISSFKLKLIDLVLLKLNV